MGIYTEAWKASAELRAIASKNSVEAWDAGNTMQLIANPDFSQNVLGIMVKLTLDPEVVTSRARNWLEDAGVIKHTSEEFGLYKEHILASLPQAADPMFVDIWNRDSVDQQKIWKYEDREFFQELGGIDIQIPFTFSELDMKKAFSAPQAMERLLAAKREGAITAFTLNMLYYEMDAISKTLNQTDLPFQASQIVEIPDMPADYEQLTKANYIAIMKAVRALRFNMSRQFTGRYNQANFPTMDEPDNLVMLIRAEIPRSIGTDLLADTFNRDEYGFDIPLVEMPHFGGLTGFNPTYNASGQQQTPISDFTNPVDPNADVFAIITTRDYFVRTDRLPVTVRSAPPNARGLYTSHYLSYSGGMNAIGYRPFIILKRQGA